MSYLRSLEYQVQYAPEGAHQFTKLSFNGNNPSTTLHDLQSDTEYVLKIKTLLTNNLETESGEFKFKTPKVAVNPISKVDVIYSSSEANVVRLQWILEPYVSFVVNGKYFKFTVKALSRIYAAYL